MNWDQLNYHISTPFLILHGTFWSSIAPSGLQSFFNPAILVFQYDLLKAFSPRVAASCLALLQSFSFVVSGLICLRISEVRGFVLCLLSPVALSEAGGTFSDLITSVPVLLSYFIILDCGFREKRSPALLLFGGVLLGFAIRLKLTNLVFIFGVPAFFLAGAERLRTRLLSLLLLLGGCILGFVLCAGPWDLELLRRFGNPVFPFYNSVFRSPDYPAVSFHDARFLPQSLSDIFRYPFYWLIGGSPKGTLSPSSEVEFRDLRPLVEIVGSAASFFIAGGLCFFAGGRTAILQLVKRPAFGLFLAVIIDFIVWLFVFGVQRYILPVEILFGFSILYLSSFIRTAWIKNLVLFCLCLLSGMTIRVPDWGHLPWQDQWQIRLQKPVDLGGPSLVFIMAPPTAFIVTSLSPDARYVGLYGGFDLRSGADNYFARRLKSSLLEYGPRRLKAVVADHASAEAARTLQSYGLEVTERCIPLPAALRVCDVEYR